MHYSDNLISESDKSKIEYGFFTRNGGCSTHPFNSLNCGLKSADSLKNITTNLSLVKNFWPGSFKDLKLLTQIHSNKVHILTNCNTSINTVAIEADAFISTVPGILIGIQTADCLPILLFNKQKTLIAAIHAGWQGALLGIINRTVEEIIKIVKNPVSISDFTALIGPAIRQKFYIVKENFYEKFTLEDKNNSIFFEINAQNKRIYFDLPGYCKSKLKKSGITSILDTNIDTYSNPDKFFSYRREYTLLNPGVLQIATGRQISVIGLKEQ